VWALWMVGTVLYSTSLDFFLLHHWNFIPVDLQLLTSQSPQPWQSTTYSLIHSMNLFYFLSQGLTVLPCCLKLLDSSDHPASASCVAGCSSVRFEFAYSRCQVGRIVQWPSFWS
jgi:hypothetical protein